MRFVAVVLAALASTACSGPCTLVGCQGPLTLSVVDAEGAP